MDAPEALASGLKSECWGRVRDELVEMYGETFMMMMEDSRAVISGSIIVSVLLKMKAADRFRWDFHSVSKGKQTFKPGDVDLYVNEKSEGIVISWLKDSCLRDDPVPLKSTYDWLANVKYTYRSYPLSKFQAIKNHKITPLNIVVVRNQPKEFIESTTNLTILDNWFDAYGIFIGNYADIIAMRATPINMDYTKKITKKYKKIMERVYRESDDVDKDDWDLQTLPDDALRFKLSIDCIKKYQKRGFHIQIPSSWW